MNKKRLTCLCLVIVLTGCAGINVLEAPVVKGNPQPGTLLKAEFLHNYSTFAFRTALLLSNLRREMPVRSGADLYRLLYVTTNHDGSPTAVSGLVALPKGVVWRGVVSYQHGTQTKREAVPSNPTTEGVLVSAVFAGGGYVLTAPDYIGLGVSPLAHPYLHADTEAAAAVDLLKAADAFVRSRGAKLPKSVYLVGFSQGGHATLATHRALEAMHDPRFTVKACAPVSGVYDLAGITFPHTLTGISPGDTSYLAYLIYAYSDIYGRPLSELALAPYDKILPQLFDGSVKGELVVAALPRMPRELFTEEFLEDYDNGRPTWFLEALEENEVYRWRPNAPVRLYYGENDIDVSPQEAETAAREFAARGADVAVVSVGDYDHGGSVLQAVPRARAWFDRIASGRR